MGEATDSERLVLEGWKRERDELSGLIEALEKRIALRAGGPAGSSNSAGKVGPDDFFRMSTPEAIKKFLRTVGKPARTTTDIIDGLKRGGMNSNYTNVYTALTRLKIKGEVAKVGDNWGLEEWYPPAKPPTDELIEKAEEFPAENDKQEQERTGIGDQPHAGTKGRKEEIAEFIRTHGPATRSEILAGTDIPKGTIGYCLNDGTMFVRGDDGKWRNVE